MKMTSQRTTSIKVRLSAYPLALWFASSWCRLRWEPAREVLIQAGGIGAALSP